MWLVVIPGPSCSPQLCRCASNSRTRRATLGGHALGLWCRRTLVRHWRAALCTRLFSRRTLRISCMVPVTMSPCTGTLYCLFIWKRCHVECGCKCVKGRNAAARTLLSHPTPPHPPASGDDAMLSVAASVSKEGTQLPGRYDPTPPHPPHLDTMPCWVWPQVCQRKERSCQDVIIPPHPTPPHLETMPCWVWLQVWQRKERSCQDVIIPPHPTASGDDAMLSVATSVSKEGTQLPGRYYPTPPHPTASGDDAMLSVATSVSEEGTQLPGRHYPTPPHPTHPTPIPRIWRRCHVECGRKCVRGRNAAARTLLSHPTPPRIWRRCYVDCGHNCDADVGFWVVRMVVGEWPFFGCEILLFWLRNRLFLVAESPFFGCGIVFLVAEAPFLGCGSASDFGCGSVEIWFRNRNLFHMGSYCHSSPWIGEPGQFSSPETPGIFRHEIWVFPVPGLAMS